MSKLAKDFGVRALLATIGGVGFYALLLYILMKYDLDLPTVLAIVGLAQTPWMLALGFYFGSRSGQPPNNSGGGV